MVSVLSATARSWPCSHQVCLCPHRVALYRLLVEANTRGWNSRRREERKSKRQAWGLPEWGKTRRLKARSNWNSPGCDP